MPPTARCIVYLRWLIALLSPALILAPAAAQGRALVPGEVDAHVTQATIHSTICEHEYPAKVRPARPSPTPRSAASSTDSTVRRKTTS